MAPTHQMIKNLQLTQILFLIVSFISCADSAVTPQELSSSDKFTTSPNTFRFTSGIRAIMQDRKGNYWIGSHSEGVCRYDGTSFTYFNTADGLANNQIRSIQEDDNGNIWFGTANGVSRFDGVGMMNYDLVANHNEPKPWSKSEQDLWFSAGNFPGVYRFDGLTFDYHAFPPVAKINANNAFLTTGISKGPSGTVWIATYAGVFGFDGTDFNIITDETLGLIEAMDWLHVRSILEDSKGRLWIGNNGIGVLLRHGESTVNFSEKHHLIHADSKKSGAPSPQGTMEHVFAITEDRNGNIWFGDRDSGLWKYDGESMSNIVVDEHLNSQMIWSIYEDPQGNMFVARSDGGIYKLDGDRFEKWL